MNINSIKRVFAILLKILKLHARIEWWEKFIKIK